MLSLTSWLVVSPFVEAPPGTLREVLAPCAPLAAAAGIMGVEVDVEGEKFRNWRSGGITLAGGECTVSQLSFVMCRRRQKMVLRLRERKVVVVCGAYCQFSPQPGSKSSLLTVLLGHPKHRKKIDLISRISDGGVCNNGTIDETGLALTELKVTRKPEKMCRNTIQLSCRYVREGEVWFRDGWGKDDDSNGLSATAAANSGQRTCWR
jgi:hypothetical protein